MQNNALPDDSYAVDGNSADYRDGESDYGQIDAELEQKIIDDTERKWAVALNEEAGDAV